MIRFVDLGRQHAAIHAELSLAIENTVQSGTFILGPTVERFERAFAGYCGVAHCVGVGSGTAALQLALEACGVGPGDEVIIPANTFIATAFAVSERGARPVLVDVEETSKLLDPLAVEQALTRRTKAIVPVHLYGAMVDMDRVAAIARAHRLTIIEDACQAHGASLNGRRAGSFGAAAAFSFYPSKNLGALGDGGAVVTDDAEIASRVRLLRDLGQRSKYDHIVKGDNSRLDSLQAAVLEVKLAHLDAWNAARRKCASRYDELLMKAGLATAPRSVGEPVFHIYAIPVKDRRQVALALDEARIGYGIHYPVPIHLQPAYEDLGYRPGDFPVSEAWSAHTLSLPMFPELTSEEIETVVRTIALSERAVRV